MQQLSTQVNKYTYIQLKKMEKKHSHKAKSNNVLSYIH